MGQTFYNTRTLLVLQEVLRNTSISNTIDVRSQKWFSIGPLPVRLPFDQLGAFTFQRACASTG